MTKMIATHCALACVLCGIAGVLAAAFAPPQEATHWDQTGWGGGGFFWCCAYHPTDPNTLYLGGDVAGAYKSVDGGGTWRFINNGLSNYGVYGMAISRSAPETLYVMTRDGICRTDDGGGQWRLLAQTAKGALDLSAHRPGSVRPIAIHPTNADVVYSGSHRGKLYKSEDGGRTWRDLAYLRTAQPRRSEAEQTPAFLGKGFLVLDFASEAGTWAQNGRVEKSLNAPGSDWSGYVRAAARFRVPPGAPKVEAQLVVQSGEKWLWQQGPWVVAKPGEWAEVTLDLEGLKELQTVHFVYVVVRAHEAAYKGEVYVDAVTLHPAGGGQPVLLSDWETPGDTEGWRANRTIKDALFVTGLHQSAETEPKERGVIASVAIAEVNPDRVFAANTEMGLFRSDDAGATWIHLNTPATASSVAVAPGNADRLYAAFGKEGIHRSDDGGATWKALPTGAPADCVLREVAVDPRDPEMVCAIGNVGWNGLFLSSGDGGKSWTTARRLTRDLAGNPTIPEETGGGAIPRGTATISRLSNLAISPGDPNRLFLAGNWHNCLSADGGKTWTEGIAGADITCAQDIQFAGGKTYVVAMDEGSFASDDGGATWRQLAPLKYTEGTSGHQWRIRVWKQGQTEKVLTTVSPWAGKEEYPNAVLVSTDGGKTFTKTAQGLPDYLPKANTMWGQSYPRAFAADPANPNVLYLGMDGDPEPAKGRPGGGVFRSTDGGLTWQPLPGQPACRRVFFGLAVDPTNPRRLFWGASGNNGGLYRSEDAGETWEAVFTRERWVFNLAVSPTGVVYCGGQNLHRSDDHGKTWRAVTRFASGAPVIVGIEIDPQDERRVWISRVTWGENAVGGVFRTADGGATWQEITGDLPYRKPILLRYNPETRELWAGGVGLFKTKQ